MAYLQGMPYLSQLKNVVRRVQSRFLSELVSVVFFPKKDMHFETGQLYHVYNRGNNKQPIFFENRNYLYFLEKVRKYILPCCDLLSYSLMPNHFHFLISADERTIRLKPHGAIHYNSLSEAIRNLLQTYSKAINKSYNRTGNLFQQNTRSKCLTNGDGQYATTCFHYIHQNAWRAGLVKKLEDWQFSSFRDFCGMGTTNLCNKDLAFRLLNIEAASFYNDSYKLIDFSETEVIFEQ